MNDTAEKVAHMVAERYRSMTSDERVHIASGLYDTARAIVESSLPGEISDPERRLAVARRLYSEDLPDSVLVAYAYHQCD